MQRAFVTVQGLHEARATARTVQGPEFVLRRPWDSHSNWYSLGRRVTTDRLPESPVIPRETYARRRSAGEM